MTNAKTHNVASFRLGRGRGEEEGDDSSIHDE